MSEIVWCRFRVFDLFIWFLDSTGWIRFWVSRCNAVQKPGCCEECHPQRPAQTYHTCDGGSWWPINFLLWGSQHHLRWINHAHRRWHFTTVTSPLHPNKVLKCGRLAFESNCAAASIVNVWGRTRCPSRLGWCTSQHWICGLFCSFSWDVPANSKSFLPWFSFSATLSMFDFRILGYLSESICWL